MDARPEPGSTDDRFRQRTHGPTRGRFLRIVLLAFVLTPLGGCQDFAWTGHWDFPWNDFAVWSVFYPLHGFVGAGDPLVELTGSGTTYPADVPPPLFADGGQSCIHATYCTLSPVNGSATATGSQISMEFDLEWCPWPHPSGDPNCDLNGKLFFVGEGTDWDCDGVANDASGTLSMEIDGTTASVVVSIQNVDDAPGLPCL